MRLSFRLHQTINHSQQKYFSMVSGFNISSYSLALFLTSFSFLSYFKFLENLNIKNYILLRNNYLTVTQSIRVRYIFLYFEIIIRKIRLSRRIEVAKTAPRPVRINFCFIGIKHFCSIEVVPWMDPLNEQSRPLFRPRTRRKEDSRSPDNNRSSSFSLVIRCMFDGREDGKPFFDFERLHSELFMKYQ